MAIPKHDYPMDYISDKDVYKAVQFASKMVRQGRTPQNAIWIAARYYKVDSKDVAHYMGQKGGRSK